MTTTVASAIDINTRTIAKKLANEQKEKYKTLTERWVKGQQLALIFDNIQNYKGESYTDDG